MSSPGPSDYAAIREEHKRRYGTDIAEFGPRLFEEQYADPRHFVLELLQNAEDALARRHRRQTRPPVAERAVRFDLTESALQVSHFGDPFDPADVKSICGIGKSTKGLENIGRFGLGFKSVYAFTDRPEIHSGPEDFLIRNYVWPEATTFVDRKEHETVIVLPRKPGSVDWASLSEGLPKMLSGPYLLFLRQIECVRWSAPDGSTEEYLRQSEEIPDAETDAGVRRVTLVGGGDGPGTSCDEDWLIFERPVYHEDRPAGRVEVAFAIDSETHGKDKEFPIRSLPRSPLYAYFPTDTATHLGFYVQGPYNTTPARDNVRWPDSWNAYLISETASLLRSALAWFRRRAEVSVSLLRCLPLEEDHFADTMFQPLFEETRIALRDDGLLPTESGPFVPASRARLGRGEKLRRLFSPEELGELCGLDEPVHWLPGAITADRAPTLRQYLQAQLEIEELDPESVVSHLTEGFLDQRSDAWVRGLYEFLADQSGLALRRSLRTKPILRLHNRQHVRPPRGDDRGVFFPSEAVIGFQTIRESVCHGDKAREFLESLGVREPDLVADIIENVLPKYNTGEAQIEAHEYQEDLNRIEQAYETDSKKAGARLIDALSETQWIQAIDGQGGDAGWSFPEDLYWPTVPLLTVFAGIESVWFLRQGVFTEGLSGPGGLLDQCGVARVLTPSRLTLEGNRLWEIGRKLRAGSPVTRHGGHDWTIEGLSDVFAQIERETGETRIERSRGLWSALRQAWVDSARNEDTSSLWKGEYHWSYSHSHRHRTFDASFIESLRESAWVADSDGTLYRPSEIVFSSLGWEDEPTLRERLDFQSDEDKQYREQDEMLTMLEGWGVTTPTELRLRWTAIAGGSIPDPAPHVDLSDLAGWWEEHKAEQRSRYQAAVFPDVLDVASLADGDRIGWFTFFGLACFRSYGRTTEAQHRGFVDRGHREGWWTELAESRPPEDAGSWLGRLQAWSAPDQTSKEEEFGMWRGSFVALYTVARWLDDYVGLMRKLPDIIEESGGRVSLREVMNPAHSPAVRRLGTDAAPLARTLGIGVNWMIRELLRAGIYPRAGALAPYAWMSTRRARDFFGRAGGPLLDGPDADHSRKIYEFVVEELGTETAEFDGDYDLPLQLWTIRGRT